MVGAGLQARLAILFILDQYAEAIGHRFVAARVADERRDHCGQIGLAFERVRQRLAVVAELGKFSEQIIAQPGIVRGECSEVVHHCIALRARRMKERLLSRLRFAMSR